MKGSKKRTALSLGVGLVLLFFLVYKSDLREFPTVFSSLRLGFWLAAFLLYLVTQLISSYRWQILLRAEKIWLPLGHLLILYFLGMFFNLFLPGSVGGDALRGYAIYRQAEKKGTALVSVVVDRFCGMGALLTIGFGAMLISTPTLAGTGVAWSLSLLMGVFLLCLAFLSEEKLLKIPLRMLFRWRLRGIGEKLIQLYDAFRLYWNHKGVLVKAILLSFLLQGLGIMVYYLLALALNIEAPLFYFFLFVPIITAATMLPVTFSGLGVREGVALLLFSRIGVMPAAAITLSLSWWFTVAIMGLLATPLWFRKGFLG